MKTIGVIGGMSWQSTQVYYHLINQGVAAKLGGYHSARMVIYSLDFAEIECYQMEGKWEEAGKTLATAAIALEKAGADLLLIATNTMHKVVGEVTQRSSLPLIHIADATAAAINRLGITRVGLLGTCFTMEQSFYSDRLRDSFNIETLIPADKDRAIINDIIYKELVKGEIKDSSKRKAVEIMDNLVAIGAQGIILGCTELPLLINPQDVNIPLFDTTAIHTAAAVEMALGE